MTELPKIQVISMKSTYERYHGPVHDHMGLSYTGYYVVPRLALQSMPVWWQKIFVWLINMLPDTPEYSVQRRATNGRFIDDPWADYRRGCIATVLAKEQGWKISGERTCQCQNQQINNM